MFIGKIFKQTSLDIPYKMLGVVVLGGLCIGAGFILSNVIVREIVDRSCLGNH
jgi:hypothetical protein